MATTQNTDLPTTSVVLVSPDERKRATVTLAGITEKQYGEISDYLGAQLERPSQAYIGVSNAMQMALDLCPKANPADLWVHLIYHQFRNRFKKSDQSWKRVGGQAWEQTIMSIYNRRLSGAGISIRFAKRADATTLGLVQRGLSRRSATIGG
jgi:hypothetical protein